MYDLQASVRIWKPPEWAENGQRIGRELGENGQGMSRDLYNLAADITLDVERFDDMLQTSPATSI